jgi:hypothetical protein
LHFRIRGGGWHKLNWTNTKLAATVAHQYSQFLDAQITYFVHPNQQRCTDWQAAVPNFADNRRRYLKRSSQGSIIFQAQLFNQRIQKALGS